MPPSGVAPGCTSQHATRHRCSAKSLAVALPMPPAAPVTIATLFSSPVSIMMSILDTRRHLRFALAALALAPGFAQQQPDLALARSYVERNMLPAAEAEVRRVLAAHPDSADAHFLLGYILFRET